MDMVMEAMGMVMEATDTAMEATDMVMEATDIAATDRTTECNKHEIVPRCKSGRL